MKKLIQVSLLLIVCAGLTNCKKDKDVEPMGCDDGTSTSTVDHSKKNAFIWKVTSTGCYPCGEIGEIIHETQDNNVKEDLVVIEYHPSAEAAIDIMAAENDDNMLRNIFDSGGSLGQFYVGDQMANLSLSDADLQEWTDNAVAAYLQESAPLYAEVEHSISGGNIIADVTVKANTTTTEDYIIGVYVIEDEILFWQSGNPNSGTYQNPSYYHKNIYRENMAVYGTGISSSNLYGSFIALEDFNGGSSTFTSGQDIVLPTLSLPIDSEWEGSNLRVVTLILDAGNQYQYINSNHSVLK